MTRYEKLIEGSNNLKAAANRAGDKKLSMILRVRASQLIDKAMALTVEEASRDAR